MTLQREIGPRQTLSTKILVVLLVWTCRNELNGVASGPTRRLCVSGSSPPILRVSLRTGSRSLVAGCRKGCSQWSKETAPLRDHGCALSAA
jgi:hypothetical protein